MISSRIFGFIGLSLSLLGVACTGGEAAPSQGAAAAGEAAAPAQTAVTEAQPTGNVIEVKMITEGAANYFEPAEITARPGDVVRFVLVSGVHNVSFPAGQNASGAELPAASQYLQAPGQTYDVTVSMDPGTYTFQCDPHAALGMVGTLTVQ